MPNTTIPRPLNDRDQEFVPVIPNLAALVNEPYTNLPNGFTKEKVSQAINAIYLVYSPTGIPTPNVDSASLLCWYGDDVESLQKDINKEFGIRLTFDYVYKTPVLDLYKKVMDILSVKKPISEIMGALIMAKGPKGQKNK